MGLKLQQKDQYGNDVEYIKIAQCNQNFADRTGVLILEIWKDRDTSKSGKYKPVYTMTVVVNGVGKIDGKGYTITLPWLSCAEKTRAEHYPIIKSRKYLASYPGGALEFDLTKAEDVLE